MMLVSVRVLLPEDEEPWMWMYLADWLAELL